MIPDLTVEPFSRTTTRGSGLLYHSKSQLCALAKAVGHNH
jgi:hypothetical protein